MGAVGLACVMGAKVAGASKIIGVDINPDKFKTGRFLHCSVAILPVLTRQSVSYFQLPLITITKDSFLQGYPQLGVESTKILAGSESETICRVCEYFVSTPKFMNLASS